MKVGAFTRQYNLTELIVSGGDDFNAACDYILNRFVSLNQSEVKQVYTHFTCATDTQQIKFVVC